MVIVPLLVLLMTAYIKVRSEGDEGAIQVFDDPVFILSSILLAASLPASRPDNAESCSQVQVRCTRAPRTVR